MSPGAVSLVCGGCGWSPGPGVAAFACGAGSRDDHRDHVLVPELDLGRCVWPGPAESNPFVRFAPLLLTHPGGDDRAWLGRLLDLSDRVARIDGRAVAATRVIDVDGAVVAKVEADGIGGSHKWRHLFGTLLGLAPDDDRPLAIASCGNAAIAAATIASAAERRLTVFVPDWAPPGIVERLEGLGAGVETVTRRPGGLGDPCLIRFRQAVEAGAVPFTCQGTDNALALDGGRTVGWELADQLTRRGPPVGHVVVQAGGGALASCVIRGLNEAARLGALATAPRFHVVQASGAAPLVRAWELLCAAAGATGWEGALHDAAQDRGRFMRPWADPHSVATGILDDETYDWLAVLRGVAMSGGSVFAVPDRELLAAAREASAVARVPVGPTGAAGLAGVRRLQRRGADGTFATILTGAT